MHIREGIISKQFSQERSRRGEDEEKKAHSCTVKVTKREE